VRQIPAPWVSAEAGETGLHASYEESDTRSTGSVADVAADTGAQVALWEEVIA
jgi:hypothetical protein